MKISELVTLWFCSAVFCYLCSSFVTWNFNPAEWKDRLIPVLFWFCVSWCVTGYYLECVKNREKER